MSDLKHTTRVIYLPKLDRYFSKLGSRKRRIQTAWCLSGAKTFLPLDNDKIDYHLEVLKEKGYQTKIITITAKH